MGQKKQIPGASQPDLGNPIGGSEGGEEYCTIRELADEFGTTVRALRFYEQRGLLHPKREGGTRLYSRRDRERLALVLRGKRLGFTLGEISAMLAGGAESEAATLDLSRRKCAEQIALLERQKREIETALAELRQIYASLGGTNLNGAG